jgi:hypothetical protein
VIHVHKRSGPNPSINIEEDNNQKLADILGISQTDIFAGMKLVDVTWN